MSKTISVETRQTTHFDSLRIVKPYGLSAMAVAQFIDGCEAVDSRDQSGCHSAPEHAPLAVVTGFLDAALRMWDDDRNQAKSRVKVAAAILRRCSDDSPAEGELAAALSDPGGLAAWQARRVKEFIDTSLHSTIRLRDCASKARLSASYFSHAFKATFGTTVCHYIRHRRVERAQQLMLCSKEPLSQIAIVCGFADQAHYCRVFREVVGMSPNAWRRTHMTWAPDE